MKKKTIVFAKHDGDKKDYLFEVPEGMEVLKCKDCKYLMFSDFYGECSKDIKGIVMPDDFCSYGERR